MISFQQSMMTWKKLRRPYEESKTLYELGIAYQKIGDRVKSVESFNDALGKFSRVGARLDVEKVLARKELLGA